MASVYNFNNAMDNWNLSQNPVAPTQGVLGSMAQSDTSAMPEIKEAAESNVPPMPTTQGTTPATPPPATVTPFGGKSSDVYKSGFDAAEERKNAWDLVKEDPQTTLIAFAMSMMANNDGTRNVSQLVGQAGLDALAAVQTREKVRYERAKEADKIGYDRFKDQRTHEMDVRKQDWSEKFQKDQSDRGWMDLGIKNSKNARELAALQRQQGIMDYVSGGRAPSSSGGSTFVAGDPFVARQDENGAWVLPGRHNADDISNLLKTGTVNGMDPAVAEKLRAEAIRMGVDPNLAMAVAMQESSGDHFKYARPNRAGAVGLMQVIPKYAEEFGYKPEDAYSLDGNIKLGVAELKKRIDQAGGNINEALLRYNWGPGHVDAYKKNGRGVDNVAISKEAYEYADRVLGRITPAQAAAAGIPVRDSNGITPVDTTGAPRTGQQPTVPGMPNSFTDSQIAAVQERIAAGKPDYVVRAENALKMNPDAQTRASLQDTISNWQRQHDSDLKLYDTLVKRRDSDPAVKAALEQGKNVETRRGKLYDEVNQLQESLGQYEAAGRLLDSERFRTGKFQDILDEGGKILHAFGFDDQTLANLRMNRPQDAEAFQNLVMRNVFNELALQKGVQTEGDAQRAERLWASIRNTKEGNKWINDFARDVIQNKINLKREEMRLLRLHNGDLDKVMDGLLEYKNNQKSMFDKGGKYADLYDKNVGSAEAQAKKTMQQATSGNPVAEAGKKKSAVDYSKFER